MIFIFQQEGFPHCDLCDQEMILERLRVVTPIIQETPGEK